MYKKITSLTNQNIKNVLRLRKSAARKKEGLTIVDGVKELQMAIKSGAVCEEVFFIASHENAPFIKKFNKHFLITEKVYEKLAYGERQEGLVAVIRPRLNDINDIKVKSDFLCVILENVEKPGNLGAILRTCDGADVDAVFICDQKTDIFNPNVIRASLGAVFTNVLCVVDTAQLMEFCKSNTIKTIATTPDAKARYYDADLKGKVAILMGEEHKGLSGVLLNKADQKVSIPMKGAADSLNVSVSTAIVVYEAVRQRKQ